MPKGRSPPRRKTDTKCVRRGHKVDTKWTQNFHKMDPKQIRNGPKMDKKKQSGREDHSVQHGASSRCKTYPICMSYGEPAPPVLFDSSFKVFPEFFFISVTMYSSLTQVCPSLVRSPSCISLTFLHLITPRFPRPVGVDVWRRSEQGDVGSRGSTARRGREDGETYGPVIWSSRVGCRLS